MPITTADKRATFRKMHETGCFVLPNPWDIGSARALQHMGFAALASTSAGFAWSIGKADNRVTLDEVCAHLTALCAAVDLPVNADFEGGFAHKPEKVAANVARAVKTGVAGLSIEDSTGDKAKPLYDRGFAIERIRAARTAIDAEPFQPERTARHAARGFVERCTAGGSDGKCAGERVPSPGGVEDLFERECGRREELPVARTRHQNAVLPSLDDHCRRPHLPDGARGLHQVGLP